MNKNVLIVDLSPQDTDLIKQIVKLLEQCFTPFSPDWLPTDKDRLEEIHESFEAGRRSRVLLNSGNEVLGWIGAIEDENLWEIHPIAVGAQHRRQGFAMMLINDVMALARASCAVAIWAGTSDETLSTNLSRADLYSDPFGAIQSLTVAENHSLNFWRNSGFTLVGVMPDEEGLNKPGIHFAKRL